MTLAFRVNCAKVYIARGLPAADSNGLSDPFVEVFDDDDDDDDGGGGGCGGGDGDDDDDDGMCVCVTHGVRSILEEYLTLLKPSTIHLIPLGGSPYSSFLFATLKLTRYSTIKCEVELPEDKSLRRQITCMVRRPLPPLTTKPHFSIKNDVTGTRPPPPLTSIPPVANDES